MTINWAKSDLAKNKFKFESLSAEVENLQAHVRDESGLIDNTGLPEMARNLQAQRETLLEEEAAATGRRAGLEDAIARVQQKAQTRAADDPVLKELRTVVEVRKTSYERLKQAHHAGIIPDSELQEAEAQLALARANAATAQQKLSGNTDETLDMWNRELLNLNIAWQERQAKLKYIDKRLPALAVALQNFDRLNTARNELSMAREELRQSQKTFDSYHVPNTPDGSAK